MIKECGKIVDRFRRLRAGVINGMLILISLSQIHLNISAGAAIECAPTSLYLDAL